MERVQNEGQDEVFPWKVISGHVTTPTHPGPLPSFPSAVRGPQ